MEGYEMDYAPEEPADQEQEETITEPEESAPEEEPEETESGEPEEAEPEEDQAEEQPEDGETGDVTDTEEEPTEEPEQETVSGNGLVVSGDVVIFPEEYDLTRLGGEPADTESIVQAVERQSDIMTAGFTCTCFMLGVLAGALVIAGFQLRRV